MGTLVERDCKHVWHPFTQVGRNPVLLPVISASGAKLLLDDGREIIDGISSWWCNLHGHSHPHIVDAISRQAATLDHVLFGGCTHSPAVTLAERIVPLLPQPLSRVFYSDNGSTAVEVALKMSIQLCKNRGRKKGLIIALENAYHGDTFGAMAVGARDVFSAPFEEHLFKVVHLPVSANDEACRQLTELCSLGDVAAFIFEPLVQGAGGFVMYEASALNRYLDICDHHGVLTIADEVMTGFGRTGALFASSHLSRTPDFVCLSKGLTGGTLPLAMTVCSDEVYDGFISKDHSKTFFHGHTYTANPIACAAAIASLDLTESQNCAEQRARIEARHRDFISSLGELACSANARQCGTVLALSLSNEKDCKYGDPIGERVARRCLAANVLLRPLGNVLYFMPPYCVTDEELQTVYGVIREVLTDS